MTPRDVMNRLRREGWTERSGKGSHRVFTEASDMVVVSNHKGDIKPGTHRSICRGASWDLSAETIRTMDVRNYIAIAEPSDDGTTWWISFPGFPGVTSAAERPEQIAEQARDALASAVEAGATLPRAIDDGEIPAYDLCEYSNPLVLLVSYAAPVPATAG